MSSPASNSISYIHATLGYLHFCTRKRINFCSTICLTFRVKVAVVEDLISFSLRIPKSLASSIEVTARRLGVSKSEYARRAMEAFEQRVMHDRIAELSHQLAAHSEAASRTMDDSTADALE